MNKELAKELRIIVLRNGVEISIEKDRTERILTLIEQRKFIEIDGRIINGVDIIGIFKPEDMENAKRRANGQWQDKKGNWRNRGDKVCPVCSNVVPFGKICGNCG
jgi:hypothetical protein